MIDKPTTRRPNKLETLAALGELVKVARELEAFSNHARAYGSAVVGCVVLDNLAATIRADLERLLLSLA